MDGDHLLLVLFSLFLTNQLELYPRVTQWCYLLLIHLIKFTFTELQNIYLVLQNMSVKMLRYILNWVEEQTYWIASRFLMLGFELDLYSPNEYCMVYWYLYVVLIKLAEKAHIRITATNGTGKFVFFLISCHVWDLLNVILKNHSSKWTGLNSHECAEDMCAGYWMS